MKKDTVRKLYQAIMNDPAARTRLAGTSDTEERIVLVLELGERFGLPVTRQEIERFFTPPTNEPLSDLELEAVVGGKGDNGEGKTIIGHDSSWWNDNWGLTDDKLEGGDGDDTIKGLGGDDILKGGGGNDSIYGGEGRDTLWGGEGNDAMEGGEGDDQLYGDDGDDTMDGGSGNDEMGGGSGDDTMHGGIGDDNMWGGTGNDEMDGGEGDDVLKGGWGDDTMDGGRGNDYMDGGWGDDEMDGGDGDDTIIGSYGDDTIRGGAGNDTLTGGSSEFESSGSDVFVFGAHDGHDVITDFQPQQDRLLLEGADSPDDIEVEHAFGSTFIVYGETRIELQGVELTKEQVWSRVDSE